MQIYEPSFEPVKEAENNEFDKAGVELTAYDESGFVVYGNGNPIKDFPTAKEAIHFAQLYLETHTNSKADVIDEQTGKVVWTGRSIEAEKKVVVDYGNDYSDEFSSNLRNDFKKPEDNSNNIHDFQKDVDKYSDNLTNDEFDIGERE